jgi:hypothetical protein
MSKSRTTPAPTTGASFVEAMDFVANGRSAETFSAPEDEATSEPAAAPAPIEPKPVAARLTAPAPQSVIDNQLQTGKKEAAEQFDYASAFLKPVRTRKHKSIYVDDALHKALAVLTQVAGVGLADLLINIANDHFERYRPAIQKYMSDQEKLRKKELPY